MAKNEGGSGGTGKKTVDLTSIIGLLLAIVMIVFGITFQMPDAEKGIPMAFLWENMSAFVDVPSILIVIGGTFASLMVSYPGSFFKRIPTHLKIIFTPTQYDVRDYIAKIVEMAQVARGDGILALEERLRDIDDEFFKSSLNLVIDAVDAEKVKQMLDSELEYMDDRHAQDRGFYAKGSAYAPAFGMIGTLIGLVNLLGSLSDPDAIAPAMAVALITTLYGSILANVVFAPISNKLKVRHDEEYLCKLIVCEGVQAIQAGDNPRFIEEKLTQLLPKKLAQSVGKNKKGKDDDK